MQVTNIFFYLASMALMILLSAVLSRLLPKIWKQGWTENDDGRLKPLDGLRGVLALSVFLHHCIVNYYFSTAGTSALVPSRFYSHMGVMPVTLFFFITGFLFWKKLMKPTRIPARQFIRDRLVRLGPAYWFACAVFFILVAEASHLRRDVKWTTLLLQAAAWLSFEGAGHDMNQLLNSRWLLGQVWTLRLEWMFYVSIPFLAWFAGRRVRLVLLLVSMAAISGGIEAVTLPGVSNYLWKTLGDYLFFVSAAFGVGMLLATMGFASRPATFLRSPVATAASLLIVAATILLVPAKYGYLESVLMAFPFACVVYGNTWFGLLVSKPMQLLGKVSYSFYLLHSLVLHIGMLAVAQHFTLASMNPLSYWTFAAGCGLTSVVASCISWQYLERPFLHGSRVVASAPESDSTQVGSGRQTPLPA